MAVRDWSVTAANNDVADAAINWAEDQAPSTVNNSARAMMAELAKYIKDIGGALTSTGSANAYAVTTNETIGSHVKPVFLAFKANFTCTGASTIAIDGLTAKPLKRSNGAAIQSGDLVSGSIYLIQYEASADVYLCLNVAGNYDPAAVAITGGTMDGVTVTTPNTGLHVLDTDASHDLIFKPGSNLTADRTLTITTGDADRTLTLGGNFTANGGTVSSGTHSGTNTGDQTISLTGDVTGSGTGSFAATIANDAVTNAKMANMAASTFKMRVTASTGDPEDGTATQATAALNAMVGDSGSGGTKGLVPAPSSGDATKVLSGAGTFIAQAAVDYQAFTADGTWTKPSGVTANSRVFIEAWGAGGGGAANTNGGGGGGGGYTSGWFLASTLGSTESVTVPAGGAVNTQGGNSSFGSWLTAYGGGGGNNNTNGGGGGGGGPTAAGSNGGSSSGGAGGGMLGGTAGSSGVSPTDGFGGGGGGGFSTGTGQTGAKGYVGGGGGGGGSNSSAAGAGGNSIYGGGGGGGGSASTGAGGTSVYGGNGGAANATGTAPGGGGGRNAAGGRAEVRVTVFK